MGIAAFTIIAARELSRYGITVNAIAPSATTRLTENLIKEERLEVLRPSFSSPSEVDLLHAEKVGPHRLKGGTGITIFDRREERHVILH